MICRRWSFVCSLAVMIIRFIAIASAVCWCIVEKFGFLVEIFNDVVVESLNGFVLRGVGRGRGKGFEALGCAVVCIGGDLNCHIGFTRRRF